MSEVTKREQTVVGLEKKLRTSRLLSLVLAVALVFVGGAYATLWSDSKQAAEELATAQAQAAQVAEAQAPGAQEPDLATEPYMVIGDDDAPVTITEWTDYTCPYCGLYHRDTLPQIIADYVDSGEVRIEIHDVTFIGDQAEDAAIAARAAGLQDRYLDYLFAVYELGADGNKPNLDAAQLTALAEELGLDMEQFAGDIASGDLRGQVQASTQKAQSLGITGVPFFIVSNTGTLQGAQSMNGAQPYENFQQVLDSFVNG